MKIRTILALQVWGLLEIQKLRCQKQLKCMGRGNMWYGILTGSIMPPSWCVEWWFMWHGIFIVATDEKNMFIFLWVSTWPSCIIFHWLSWPVAYWFVILFWFLRQPGLSEDGGRIAFQGHGKRCMMMKHMYTQSEMLWTMSTQAKRVCRKCKDRGIQKGWNGSASWCQGLSGG